MSDLHSDLQGNWIWYELLADDPHAAKAFYEAVVGWSITLDAMPMSEPDTAYAMITADDGQMVGGMLTITAEMKAQGARTMWLGYVSVADCAATLAAIEKRGGRVLMPATTLDVGTIAMVMDPWGAPFYIMTPTPRPDGAKSTAFSPTQVGRCGWNELHTSDQASAVGFYTELFGWALPGSMDMGSFGTYQFIGKGEVTLGAIMTSPPQSPPPHWNHYFRVVSIPAAKAAVEEHGGQVVHGPMEVPGGDWILMGIDPQGAPFALVGANSAATQASGADPVED